jgi:anti-sigma B factor antagonist
MASSWELVSEPGGELRLLVRGDLDVAAADSLLADVARAVADEPARVIVLDLTDVEFIDSSGLRVLLEVHRGHPSARLGPRSASVDRVLELTGTDDLLARRRSDG